MKYELLANSDYGHIIDPTPILRDIKDTFTVSFVLPESGAYVALFRDESGVEHRAALYNDAVKVPKQILTKEQRIGLTVCRISDDANAILQSWECQTLKIGTFLSLRQTQWQITVGTDDKELYAKLSEIEQANTNARTEYGALLESFDALRAEFAHCQQNTERAVQENASLKQKLTDKLTALESKYNAAVKSFNAAVDEVNKLSERLAALEANYDPTIID